MARQFAGGVGVLAMAAIDTQIGIVAVQRWKLHVPKSKVLKTPIPSVEYFSPTHGEHRTQPVLPALVFMRQVDSAAVLYGAMMSPPADSAHSEVTR
jgi:hypothetical protein